jgi:hypothetical protein
LFEQLASDDQHEQYDERSLSIDVDAPDIHDDRRYFDDELNHELHHGIHDHDKGARHLHGRCRAHVLQCLGGP